MRALLLGLVGCVAPGAEVDDWGEVDGVHLLVDDAHDAFAERVQPLAHTAARLVPDGPLLEGAAAGLDSLVVVDPTPWPRVVVDADDVQVLVYVDRGTLEARVVAAVEGTGRDGDGSVRLRPGAVVERVDAEDDRVQISARVDPELEITAWLPRSAVDEVWSTGRRRARASEPPEGTRHHLGGAVSILDRPAGDPLATIGATTYEVVATGEEDGGWLPVVLETGEVRVEGWVHVDDLTPVEGLIGHCGCRGGYGGLYGFGRARFWDSRTVPAGTWLHAGVEGPVVARTTRNVQIAVEDYFDGVELRRRTPLGWVDLWAAPEDIR